MSVLIHPTACSPAGIAKIQRDTGLRAVIGKTFGHLVTQNGHAPIMRKTKRANFTVLDRGPFDGGAAA